MNSARKGHTPASEPQRCYCGRPLAFYECCQTIHNGLCADSPETLMRARFSAFAVGNLDYLKTSWHSSTQPETLTRSENCHWKCLEVLASKQNGQIGQVHFRAYYIENDRWTVLEEVSEFVREANHWFYLKGKIKQGAKPPSKNAP